MSRQEISGGDINNAVILQILWNDCKGGLEVLLRGGGGGFNLQGKSCDKGEVLIGRPVDVLFEWSPMGEVAQHPEQTMLGK